MTYTDSGLGGDTAYDYQVVAAASESLNGISYSVFSPTSLLVAATTLQSDTLSINAVSWSATVGSEWSGTIATFTDTNGSRGDSSFTATVNWGDGTQGTASITEEDGTFYVSASHTYLAIGDYSVQVQVELTSTLINASTLSTAVVGPASGPLASLYNEVGITAPGSSVVGDLDASDDSYSSSSIGDSVTWGSNSFYIAPANVDDVVAAMAQTVTLSGSGYTAIELLGTATGGVYQPGTFTVNYSDGTSLQYTLGLSDWNNGYTGQGTNAPGETTVLTLNYLDAYSNGAESTTTTKTYLYGYIIPVNPGGTLESLTLPNNSNIKILSLDLIMQPPQVDLAAPGSTIIGDSSFNDIGITADGVSIPTDTGAIVGLGNTDAAYSATKLGTSATWDGQTFNFGAADSPDTYAVNGWPINLPQGEYTNLLILGAATAGVQSVQITVVYANGQQVPYTQDFSNWVSGYTGPGTTAPGESIVKQMSYYDDADGNEVGTTVYLYGYNIALNPNEPVSYVYFNNNVNQSILAVDVVNDPAQVNMAAPGSSLGTSMSFNAVGITLDSESGQYDESGGGINGSGNSYSANELGTTLTWDGQTFNLGDADTDSVYDVNGWPINVPHGSYTNLLILGAAFGVESADITVNYVGGTSVTFEQDFSDWQSGVTEPGESLVDHMPYYDDASGKVSTTVYVYGFNLPADPTKTISSITFDNNTQRFILAVDAVNEQPQVDMGAPGSSYGVSTAFNQVGITTVGGGQLGSLNVSGETYVAGLLGTTVTWDGQTFDMGPADTNDDYAASGAPIFVAEGSYTNLLFYGAGIGGVQSATIYVCYTDGTDDVYNQDMSDWMGGYTGPGTTAPGESIAGTTLDYNDASGEQSGKVYVYGYDIPVNPGKTVEYVKFNNNNNEIVLAVDLINSGTPQVNLAAPGSSLGTNTSFNAVGITLDDASSYYDGTNDGVTGGINHSGESYSANELGTTLTWDGQTFNFGGADVNDVYDINGWPIYIPEGSYTNLLILRHRLWTPDRPDHGNLYRRNTGYVRSKH